MAKLYEPLINSPNKHGFRLVKLHCSITVSDPIICTLESFPLEEHPDYEALSYCWGDAENPAKANCNGQEISIRQNLESALRHLRLPDRGRILWIDAICINQNDLDERSSQVAIMQQIYLQAVKTVIWLGDSWYRDKNSSSVFSMCERIFHSWREVLLNHRLYGVVFGRKKRDDINILRQSLLKLGAPVARLSSDERDDVARSSEAEEEGASPSELEDKANQSALSPSESPDRKVNITPDELQALCLLLQRPWFRRCWVLQEVCVAHNVIVACGDSLITWDQFIGAFFTIFYVAKDNVRISRRLRPEEKGLTTMALRRAATKNNMELPTFLTTMWQFRWLEATDPRDKVYSFLGLVNSGEASRSAIQPDYQLPVKEVYKRSALAILRGMNNLDLLTTVQPVSSAPEFGLPSWVPNWATGVNSIGLLEMDSIYYTSGEIEMRRFNASGLSKTYQVMLKDLNNLLLSGFITDRIVHLGPKLSEPKGVDETAYSLLPVDSPLSDYWDALKRVFNSLGAWLDVLVQWEDLAQTADPYPTNESPLIAFSACLTAGYFAGGPENTLSLYREWRSKTLRGSMLLAPLKYLGDYVPNAQALYSGLLGFLGTILRLDSSADPVLSQTMGLSMERRLAKTERGYLALVPGGAMVGDGLALFQGGRVPFVTREHGDKCELIGGSYVHGIMYGESWDVTRCIAMEII
ncbi:Fc.00g043190.m01.CDS01 [Cosmosporella sp. VM-42]